MKRGGNSLYFFNPPIHYHCSYWTEKFFPIRQVLFEMYTFLFYYDYNYGFLIILISIENTNIFTYFDRSFDFEIGFELFILNNNNTYLLWQIRASATVVYLVSPNTRARFEKPTMLLSFGEHLISTTKSLPSRFRNISLSSCHSSRTHEEVGS